VADFPFVAAFSFGRCPELSLAVASLDRYSIQDHVAAEVARIYTKERGQPFFVAVGYFPSYDIISQDREICVEVKCETTPIRTGNVAIEYWNAAKDIPSGILVTKANLWVHIVLEANGFHAYEYEVPRLKKLVTEQGQLQCAGRISLFKTIPLKVFAEHARRKFPFNTAFAAAIKELADIPTASVAMPRATLENEDELGLTTVEE
jgi:hypothetical protein